MTISMKIRHTVYASQSWYHGSPTMRMSFEDQVWDRKRGERDLNENGPGLYFTDSIEEAKAYGQYLFEAKMEPGFSLMPNKKPTLNLLLSIFTKSSKEDQETFLSNWGENIKPKEALANYIKPTIHDSAVALYGDLVRSPADWVKIMVALGYDGIVINRPESKHLLVWNPSRLNLL